VVLHNGEDGSSDNLIRTFTASTTPSLATHASEPAAGAWRLRIADTEAPDAGKLNHWRLVIKPPAS
jgi:subtilisin-like proprotein convertase family protein